MKMSQPSLCVNYVQYLSVCLSIYSMTLYSKRGFP